MFIHHQAKKLEYKNQLTTTKKRATHNEPHASLLL
jgi:hypothetical protein